MRLIINAEPEDAAAVLALIMEQRDCFGGDTRYGWGWPIPNGQRFFVRQIKGGFSARPVKEGP